MDSSLDSSDIQLRETIENYQNIFHSSLRTISSENDNLSGLRFGKTLLCLKSICQQTHRISVEDMFFVARHLSAQKSPSIAEIIREGFDMSADQEMIKAEPSANQVTNSETPIDIKNQQQLLSSLQLPNYLNAYYSQMQQRKNNFELANSQQQKSLIANSIFNNIRNPFLFHLPNYPSQTFV